MMNTLLRHSLRAVGLIGALAASSPALAAVPTFVPVQGVLSATDTGPVDESLSVVFELYSDADGTQVVWTETQEITFERGYFTARLGTVEALDAELFASYDQLWLGVAVDGDEPMAPIALGTAPYAAQAAFAANAATLEGRAADTFADADHTHQFDALTDLPADLADGDDDTTYDVVAGGGLELNNGEFGLMSSCAEGDQLARTTTGWDCVTPQQTDLTPASIAQLQINGTVLEIVEGGASYTVDLATVVGDDTDAANELLQQAALNGATLELVDAGGTKSVDLSSLVDDADADPTNELVQSMSFDGVSLSVSDAGGTKSVDLSSLVNDADADPTNELVQSMSFDGVSLSVSDAGGTKSVDLSSLVSDADADPTNELQSLGLSGDTLGLSGDAATVDLSAYRDNTDAQTLAVSGSDLSISGGNTVSLGSLQDNLGDHTATTNVNLGGNWLSGDGGAEGIYVDANGNVGVGTSSPLQPLEVSGAIQLDGGLVATATNARAVSTDASFTTPNRVYLPNANTRIWQSFTVENTGLLRQFRFHHDSDPVDFGILEVFEGEGTGGLMLLSQNVTSGTGWTTYDLAASIPVRAGEQLTVRITDTVDTWRIRFHDAGGYAGGRASTSADIDLIFTALVASDPTLIALDGSGDITVADGAIWIDDATGNVGIGTSAPTALLQVGQSGDGTVAVANSWNTFSDARWKTDVAPIEAPVEKLLRLSGYTYRWRNDPQALHPQVGVMAQEVEEVLPELVAVDGNGYRSVEYGKLSALLIEGFKTQQSTISDQARELEILRRENRQLRDSLAEVRDALDLD